MSTSMATAMGANTDKMMANLANMLGLVQQDARRREDVLRGELITIQTTIQNMNKNTAGMAAQV